MIVIALGLTLIGFDTIHEVIIPPLYSFWLQVRFLITILWQSQDQYFLWGLFILLSFIMVLFSLIQQYSPKQKPEKEDALAAGQIRKWTRRLNLMDKGVYYRWQFSQHVSDLVLKIVCYQTGKSEDEVKDEIRSGLIDLPPQLLSYLRAAFQPEIKKYFSTYRQKDGWDPIRNLDGKQLSGHIDELLD
jgi:hypothetical protein